jgi:hypothetical protein
MHKPVKKGHEMVSTTTVDPTYLYRRVLELEDEIHKLAERLQKLEGERQRFAEPPE